MAPLLALALAAASGRARVVTAEELATKLGSVVVLDARDEADFRRGHVPGSRRVDWRDWVAERPGAWNLLTGDPARWGRVADPGPGLLRRLRALGLSNEKTVVVVGSPSGWGEEGRIAWSLLYWGADDVALLDGGLSAWSADPSRPLEVGDERPGGAPGTFRLGVRSRRRIELAELRTLVGGPVSHEPAPFILDARTAEEWDGKTYAGQKRGGHLPRARLVPYRSLWRPDGRYAGAAELERLTGLRPGPGPSPVSYCTGGVRSALLAVLLEARLGILTLNYDGSMWEWSARPELPLVSKGG